MLRRTLLALFALVALLGPLAPSATASAPATAPSGSVGIRLVDVPVVAQADPRAHAYIVDRLAPGTTITRRVEVQNDTLTAQSVRVYAGPATITAGTFTVGGTDAAPTELTTWTTVAPPRLELPPRAPHRRRGHHRCSSGCPRGRKLRCRLGGDHQPGSSR